MRRIKAIGSVSGLEFKEPTKARWNLNGFNASNLYRVGLGMLVPINGRKASLI
jgi:hypothetical protein